MLSPLRTKLILDIFLEIALNVDGRRSVAKREAREIILYSANTRITRKSHRGRVREGDIGRQ